MTEDLLKKIENINFEMQIKNEIQALTSENEKILKEKENLNDQYQKLLKKFNDLRFGDDKAYYESQIKTLTDTINNLLSKNNHWLDEDF